MRPTVAPRIKICCIGSVAEAQLAVRHGASALGLVSAMPSGPGVIGEERIAEIAAAVPPPVDTFLLTSAQEADTIVQQQRRCGAGTLQLCDRIEPAVYATLREALPGVKLAQVVHVRGPEAVEEAQIAARHADAVLLDSGNQEATVKELGGTGRVHDWAISRRIREEIDAPFFLAGGLTAENVREAIETVAPFGLDVCSGVRTEDDQLDEAKLSAFFREARPATAVRRERES